ncbi:DNA-binding transcriptional response regulator [Adhaeribacter radiodurans]|uniref:Response regulator n=1 Tax=Adhaeribacter radiodurans TaxID=2745197 RepID=A0A7L7L4H2_9BACT|nr:hypothetical protein [Adhaeribacter radiodurans]QMU27696.1 hypothetical protein HUW48_06380 [Adhaeribacter radiodurans]
MAKIAFVDDDKEIRESLSIKLSKMLRKSGSTLEVIDIFPFQDFAYYFPWIEENDICVIILDERLFNGRENGKGPVKYRGSELVRALRERFKDMPIYTLSAYTADDDLQHEFNEFDSIIRKRDFADKNKASKYVEIIIRASQRYLKENEKELSTYDELTRKVASGQSDEDDIQRLQALQTKLHLPMMDSLKDRNTWLDEYESQVNSLNDIKRILEEKIKKINEQ